MKFLDAFRGRPIAQQVMVLMFVGLAVATALNIAIVALQPPPPRQVRELGQIVAQIKTVLPQLRASGAKRPALDRISSRALQFSVSKQQPEHGATSISRAMERRVAQELGVSGDDVRARTNFSRSNFVRQLVDDFPPSAAALDAVPFFGGTSVAVRIAGDEWLVAQNPLRPQDWDWVRFVGFSFVGSMLLLTPIALMFAQRLAAPIGRFAEAAERLGRDPDSPFLDEQGPRELRSAVRSFNTMQDRLRRFVAGRTLMLGAISHDLRTPLQRLRFRIDALPDDARVAMLADIEEMESMVASSLSFAQDDAAPPSREQLDLGALVSSVCDDAADSGGEAQCIVDERVVVRADPIRLKRALSNLISNALKYAGAAEVRVSRQAGGAVVEVADRGPGIPAERIDEMFQPFRRLEPSRSRATGGTGLGLSIARTIARAHGGDVTLTQRPGGGLTARLALPV